HRRHGGGQDPQTVAQHNAAATCQQEYRRREERCRDQHPGKVGQVHQACTTPSQLFSRLTSSSDADPRVRKMDTMMARPMTTSAAATTMTKNASTCPCRSPCMRAKVTRVRLAAFSISSTQIGRAHV